MTKVSIYDINKMYWKILNISIFKEGYNEGHKMNWSNAILNIFFSFVASFFFWVLTFKISFTKIIFSEKLVKSKNSLTDAKKAYGYRVRFANIGFRDLMEITLVAKLLIKTDTRDLVYFLDIANFGEQYFISFLPGILTSKMKKESSLRTLTLYPSETMQHELCKRLYPKRIRKLARKKKIQFEDIFNEFGKNVTITIYIYGNDKSTGTRKMFESQHYTMKDIEEGVFYGSKEISIPVFRSKKIKRKLISKIYRNKECDK